MTERLVGGRYQLGPKVGSGGMGHVWLAHDDVLSRSVAVKEILLPEGLTDEEREELRLRTLREARTAARLNHPNVVRVYDVIFDQDRPWIIMEYVPSRSLAQAIREFGPMTPERAARVGLAMVDALATSHIAGVLHRDVKPGNVLLANDGRVMLTDFGLATFEEITAPLTQTGIVYGSPQFIAPERALDGTSSQAADMWSLGATLYAAVEGHAPYSRQSSYATLAAMATAPPDPPRRAGALEPVLIGLLSRDPRNRMLPVEARNALVRIVTTGEAAQNLVPRPRRRGEQVGNSGGLRSNSGGDRAGSGGRPTGQHELEAAEPSGSGRDAASGGADVDEPTTKRFLRGRRAAATHRAPEDIDRSVAAGGSGRDDVVWAAVLASEEEQPAGEERAVGRSLPRRTPGRSVTDWPSPDDDSDLPPWPEELLTQVNVTGKANGTGSPLTDRRVTQSEPRDAWHWAPAPRRTSRWIPATVILVVVLLLGGLLAWHEIAGKPSAKAGPAPSASPLTGQEFGGPGPGGPGGPGGLPPFAKVGWLCQPTAPPGAGRVPASAPLAGDPSIPADWSWYTNSLGYHVAVPTRWLIAPGDPTTCFYDDHGQRFLFINQWASAGSDATNALLSREAELRGAGGMPFYRRVAINAVSCTAACAELEFTFDGPRGLLHGIVWDYIMPSGVAYSASWITTEASWAPNIANLNRVISRFIVTR